MKIRNALFSLAIASISGPTFAYDFTTPLGHVTVFNATQGSGNVTYTTGTPANAVFFQMDVTVGDCAANTWLAYTPKNFGNEPTATTATTNNLIEAQRQLTDQRAALSSIQLAMMLGTKVQVAGFNKGGGSYCRIVDITNTNTP